MLLQCRKSIQNVAKPLSRYFYTSTVTHYAKRELKPLTWPRFLNYEDEKLDPKNPYNIPKIKEIKLLKSKKVSIFFYKKYLVNQDLQIQFEDKTYRFSA